MIIESLIQGDVLVIFEGLDEVPVHMDRSELIKEINALLERPLDYDEKANKLFYSVYEQKESCGTEDPDAGNPFIITSRIEGNYFDEINFYIPRLTIEDMSNDALRSFCSSYMECIKEISLKNGRFIREYKSDQLYNDITKNKDIFQLAINPQLANVIAAIYNQYGDKLSEKRIEEVLGLNTTMIWSIMQELVEYLHSKAEGLTEDILREIIRKCLVGIQSQSLMSSEIKVENLI
ncbi:unnamed protein product [Didymodactylos carnosus]|uniref:Uncharacterized protein n=2 Tax=Didymodactylos carnosus TaxID=1234261 RepID=A0A815ZQ59_9BILA|nr:unnamed protein product [Didymodactylos carnosus]CAF4456038.1 unnamed protein product [Didymodactylos carnosus]